MAPEILTEIVLAGIVIPVAALAGFLVQRGQRTPGFAAFLLGGGALVASALCVAGTYVGLNRWGARGAWLGLIFAILLTGLLGWQAGNRVVRGHAGQFAAGSWFGFCACCIFGYLAGGRVGLLTIALPAVCIFWIGLFRVSAYILPQDKSQRQRAFRSLLTFTMGTNYPYYFVRDGKADLRVDGSPYNQFFAGPGLVYVDCDQAAYLTDGIQVKGVLQPGLNFTTMFDRPPKPVDLRPQLCSLQVEAMTKDGIPIRVHTFIPFRVHPGNETGAGVTEKRRPELGKPFPFRRRSIHQIAARELVERKEGRAASGDRLDWTTSLIPWNVTRILQDIVSRYNVDDLCAPFDPDRGPYDDIVTEMRSKLQKDLTPLGVDLVGGWLGSLDPVDEEVTERRLENWKTEWEREILLQMSEGKAERARQIERARAQAELKILLRFGQVAQAVTLDAPASQTALALRFIDCLGEIVSESEGQWPLPESVRATLQSLRGELEEGTR